MRKTIYEVNAPVRLRIAVLADFHGSDPEPALEMLTEDPPDLILLPGDMIRGSVPKGNETAISDSPTAMELLRGCAGIAPTFASLGNHEWAVDEEDLAQLQQTGATVLDDSWIEWEPQTSGHIRSEAAGSRQRILIGGLSSGRVSRYREYLADCRASSAPAQGSNRYPFDKKEVYARRPRAQEAWLTGFEKQEGYRILLSHHPEYWSLAGPKLIGHPIDLILSGHAHGGQIRIADHGLVAPGQGLMSRILTGRDRRGEDHHLLPRFTKGIHEGEYGRMVISCGMSNPQWPIPRWGNPCEILYLELRPR